MAGVDNEVLIIENNDEASVWTQRHEEIFIELMEEEVLKGNKNITTFTKQSLTREVNATDEVWDKLIQVNKSAKIFRKKGCKFYEKLCTIFGDTTATGSNAHPSTRSPSNDGDHNNDDATLISLSTRNKESGFDEDGSKRRGKSTTTSNSRSRKKSKFSSALADALATYNETAKQKTELIERSMATSTSHYLLDESVEALNQIDGISGEVYTKAFEKFENEVSRALFLKMPEHRRID
ncbi:uncharacterized protein LOC133791432 [Humulus lupulus]|uniref:uncharacterized protein LOC133791432 n=1 Tax=Humulus lupulus TaxID=3486 RepID=UPI002B408758|nr:uncharacterized protein LOC133791432 [Humulus lupulus]